MRVSNVERERREGWTEKRKYGSMRASDVEGSRDKWPEKRTREYWKHGGRRRGGNMCHSFVRYRSGVGRPSDAYLYPCERREKDEFEIDRSGAEELKRRRKQQRLIRRMGTQTCGGHRTTCERDKEEREAGLIKTIGAVQIEIIRPRSTSSENFHWRNPDGGPLK
ncbi:hypothetical protein B296_00017575 [Ensete ventricosum]|uniref:Uncharacterized protein n=1 Tax=Ensete ventricosum TaxID=4639 RepID=A0A427ATJ3_ENSVE|nr:hypothetical protein B296_00017575 [Ensete ventricosum]